MKKMFIYITAAFIFVVGIFFFSGDYKYSHDQKEVIEAFGMPDAFDIYFFTGDKSKQERTEKWYYFKSRQEYVFVNGSFMGIEETLDDPDAFVPVPYKPGDFQEVMRWEDLKPFLQNEEYLKASDDIPEIFQDLDLELYYSKQLVAGFEKISGDFIYVRALALVPEDTKTGQEESI